MSQQTLTFSNKFLRRLKIALIVLFIVAMIGIFDRLIANYHLRQQTIKGSIPSVVTYKVSHSGLTEEIILPGTLQPWHETTIYARTNGYMINWLVDIGEHVKKGQLLATISSPEVDADLRQTKAELKTAQANSALAKITAKRWKNLVKTEAVSKQETDEKVSQATALEATVKSTQANVERLQKLVGFEKVIAPFDGFITSRTTDIGRLINAGSGSTLPLFSIVQANPLRLYIRIPQYYVAKINKGLQVYLSLAEHPEKTYSAKLLNTAQAIETNTRTLLAQFEVDNSRFQLLPGSYVEVHLQVTRDKNTIRLPVNTLIFRANGAQVAALEKDNLVNIKAVVIGRDLGDTLEIISGVKPGENIIVNPADDLRQGQKVNVVSLKE
jgi:RND family efflux transporter MFP subunit